MENSFFGLILDKSEVSKILKEKQKEQEEMKKTIKDAINPWTPYFNKVEWANFIEAEYERFLKSKKESKKELHGDEKKFDYNKTSELKNLDQLNQGQSKI